MSHTPTSLKKSVLVVDDTAMNIDVLRGILSDDYIVKVATSAKVALQIVNAAAPDLILLDVMMPDMDGYEMCKRLKENPKTHDIPVIFVTAKSETADEVQGLMLGAADYLTKPVIPAIVKARVSTQLALRQASLELEERNLTLNDEKALLEDIVTRMRSASPFDARHVRLIQKSLEKTAGDIALSAYRPDGAQHVLVGDFSGHGLPAAFAAPLASYIFYHLTAEGHDMRHILTEVNTILCRQLPTQLYMAASALEFSPAREQIKIWNNGLPPLVYFSQTTGLTRIKSSGLALGMVEASEDYQPHAQFAVQPDMRFYQYSDGLTEAESPAYEMYGQQRLETLLTRVYHEQLSLEKIWKELDLFCGKNGLSDDAILLETAAS